jgi:iron complex transport system ATP-binding protein
MNTSREKILSFESLLIGYKSGHNLNILLPPFDAFALKGELIAVVGQNGVGKSTLLRTISGLQKTLGGMIYLNGRLLEEFSKYNLAQNIGYISTEPVRVSNMKVYDLVSLGRYPHTNWMGEFGNTDRYIVSDAIEKVGMGHLARRYINELSDGERQRAMIARVLAQDTDIMIMDEPTAFLDIRSRYEIVHLLHDLSKNKGKTIIFSTHDLITAISESDKIWLTLKDSLIEGAPEDLILNGSLNMLFNDSLINFSVSDGSFTFRREMHGKVFVDANGIEKYWTGKAVNRAGFEISNDPAEVKFTVTMKNDHKKWIVSSDSETLEFGSLYDLVYWLNYH